MRKKGAHCLNEAFFHLTLKIQFKVTVMVNKLAHSSQVVKDYLVLKFGRSIVSHAEDPLLSLTDPRFQKSCSRRLGEYLDRICDLVPVIIS